MLKPRILFHSECLFFSGSERMLINFFKDEKFRSEFEVSFITSKSEKYLKEFLTFFVPDFDYYQVRFPKQFYPSSDFKFLPRSVSVLCRKVTEIICRIPVVVLNVCLLIPYLRRIKPDIVHINNGGYPGSQTARAMVLASRIVGVRSIFMVVNNEALNYRLVYRWFDRPTDWLVSRAVTNFITGSKSSANNLNHVLKLGEHKVVSFPNGVICRDSDESKETIRRRVGIDDMFSGLVGLVVSRFEYRKGHLVLLEALEILKKSGAISSNNLRIIFEGKGPELQKVLDTIRARDLSSIVIFVGDEKNIANLYHASDFLLLPSVCEEDFSNVISESMSHGLCVIATDVGGAREQVSDGQTGFIVSPNNPIKLSDVILKVVSNPAVASMAGRKGKDRYLNNFTPEIAVKRYFDLYKESIQT